jgi:site-specific DNA-cytosine methylase
VFVEILNHIKKLNQDVKFLLENVNMKKDHLRVISEYVGVFPENINSNLVSAQNRDRWYWSNIKTKKVGLFDEIYTDIPQPKDMGILLKDILEDEVDEKYFLSDKMVLGLQGHSDKKQSEGCGFKFEPGTGENKAKAVTQRCFKMGCDDNYIVAMRGRNPDNPSDRRTGSPTEQRLEPNTSGKTNCLTSVQKDNLVITSQYIQWDGKGFEQDNRAYFEDGKSGTVDLKKNRQKILLNNSRIRRLTPLECARLQTIPAWYKWECSDTQQYKLLGNGWSVEIIVHILSVLI